MSEKFADDTKTFELNIPSSKSINLLKTKRNFTKPKECSLKLHRTSTLHISFFFASQVDEHTSSFIVDVCWREPNVRRARENESMNLLQCKNVSLFMNFLFFMSASSPSIVWDPQFGFLNPRSWGLARYSITEFPHVLILPGQMLKKLKNSSHNQMIDIPASKSFFVVLSYFQWISFVQPRKHSSQDSSVHSTCQHRYRSFAFKIHLPLCCFVKATAV